VGRNRRAAAYRAAAAAGAAVEEIPAARDVFFSI
jgi:hypothetical protein